MQILIQQAWGGSCKPAYFTGIQMVGAQLPGHTGEQQAVDAPLSLPLL